MHHRGQPLRSIPTLTVTLPRHDGPDWTFTLQPLPLGFHRRLRDHGLTPPAPPTRIARDSTGRPLRDSHGLAVAAADTSDPQYQAELETYHQRIAVLAVAEALRADPDIHFDTPVPKPADGFAESWTAYADALYAELERSGFSAGDLILLCNHIGRLSNLLGDHLQETRANFSTPPIAAGP